MKLIKSHALGNDFLLIDAAEFPDRDVLISRVRCANGIAASGPTAC